MPRFIGYRPEQSQGTMRQQAFQENIDRMAQGLNQWGAMQDKKKATARQRALDEQEQAESDFKTALDLTKQAGRPVSIEEVRSIREQEALGPDEFGPPAPSGLSVLGDISQRQLSKEEEIKEQKRLDREARKRNQPLTFAQRKELKKMGLAGKRAPLSEFDKTMQRETAKKAAEYQVGGGKQTAEANIKRFKGALEKMAEKGDISGGVSGYIPFEAGQDFFNANMASVRDDIRSAIQGSLKATLGGQFTEKEAEQMFARAFNPRLSDEENIRRATIELSRLENIGANKEAAIAHMRKFGTMEGFEPVTVPEPNYLANTGEDLAPVNDSLNVPFSPTAGPMDAVAAPVPMEKHPQVNEALQWARQNPNDPRAQKILNKLGAQ